MNLRRWAIDLIPDSPALGLYRPGTSWLHRLGAGAKLLGLAVLGAASVALITTWWAALIAAALVVVAYLSAGFTVRVLWSQVRPMWFIVAFTAVFHVWINGWERAVVVTAVIVALVATAALVTLTTTTMAMLGAIVAAARPLQRIGVDPERVGLFLVVGIRAVPLVAQLARDVREAQIARRATTSVSAFAVPLIVRSLREADALGEALVARGVDD